MSYWRNKAAPIIARVLEEHAAEDETALQAALRDAYPFGVRKHHPYQIWLDEVKRQRGLKPKLGTVRRKPPDLDPRQESLFPTTEERA